MTQLLTVEQVANILSVSLCFAEMPFLALHISATAIIHLLSGR